MAVTNLSCFLYPNTRAMWAVYLSNNVKWLCNPLVLQFPWLIGKCVTTKSFSRPARPFVRSLHKNSHSRRRHTIKPTTTTPNVKQHLPGNICGQHKVSKPKQNQPSKQTSKRTAGKIEPGKNTEWKRPKRFVYMRGYMVAVTMCGLTDGWIAGSLVSKVWQR